MRFKIDENVHPDAAVLLRGHGHDVLTVWDEGLRGTGDENLAKACRSEHRALLTFDVGFANISAYPPEEHDGFIVLRLSSQRRAYVMGVLQLLKTEPLVGQLWIVQDDSIRVRGCLSYLDLTPASPRGYFLPRLRRWACGVLFFVLPTQPPVHAHKIKRH